jgi:hypothetical protein
MVQPEYQRPRTVCREIETADLADVINLLTNGFHHLHRTRGFWMRSLERLSAHPSPAGFPRYGYVLEVNGSAVGVILLIFSSVVIGGERKVRCNISSWYVEPAFRGYAAILVSHALKHKHVTYFNITPAPATVPILEAQGYARYCTGRVLSVPALSGWFRGVSVNSATSEARSLIDLPSAEIELLLSHAQYGCRSLICRSENRAHPFVFATGRRLGLIRYAYLVYCRDLDDFVRFAGPLGRFLLLRGYPLVAVDSNGPIRGLVGKYSAAFPKYFKGPDQPRLGDLAYSERAIFGF